MNPPLLEVRDLTKHFTVDEGWLSDSTTVRAVDGISFSIDEGETLALIGESGSGKSTVAKTIIGLHRATDGLIRLGGMDISNPTERRLKEVRSRIQMVFQDPTSSLNPRRTAGKSIEVPLAADDVPKTRRRERAVSLLERVGLSEEHYYRHPHELSGGQKQRVNIARAIAVKPELLLLDEPTSALDVSVQAKIVDLLAELQADLGLSYLFITHDLSLVRNVADETAVMYLGEIQEHARTDELFESPRHPYTQALLSSIPVTSEAERAYKPHEDPLEGEIPSPRDVPSGCRFHTRCPFATEGCTSTVPEEIETDGRSVRCHLYDPDRVDAFDFEEVPESARRTIPSEPR